jgi:hypothetical protein
LGHTILRTCTSGISPAPAFQADFPLYTKSGAKRLLKYIKIHRRFLCYYP